MTPYLTKRGKAVLAVILSWLVFGAALLVFEQPEGGIPLLSVATLLLLMMLGLFLQAVPLGWILDRRFLRLTLHPPDPAEHLTLHTFQNIHPQLEIENLSGRSIRCLRLVPEISTALELDAPGLPILELPPSSQLELPISMHARVSGRWFIHGFHVRCRDASNLFEISDYIPSPQSLKFLPRGLVKQRRGARPNATAIHDRVGVHELRQRGNGSSLREIREHQHGDPFRNIAWKATARTNKLMVREFEREVTLNAYILLDTSATMRGLNPSGSKLEHASQLACDFARTVLKGNDRCGLITFDEKLYGHLPPREGNAQVTKMTQHLMGLSNVIDEDLTAADEQEVIETLIRYLLVQERLDFRLRGARRPKSSSQFPSLDELYDLPLLTRWLHRQLPALEESSNDPSLQIGVLQNDTLSIHRRYCRMKGIELPYRAEVRYGTKEKGMVKALEKILTESRNPHIILLISDLSGIVNPERLVKALTLARIHRHRVAILAPYTPLYAPTQLEEPGEQSLQGDPTLARREMLHQLFSMAEARERRGVVQAIRKARVPVVEVGPDSNMVMLLKRLKLFR